MTKLRANTGKRSGAYLGYRALGALLGLLRDDRTPQALSTATGVALPRMRSLLKQFLALSLVDRVGWERPPHGYATPVYRLGYGYVAPAPLMPCGQPQTHADFKPALQPRIVAFASIVQALRLGGPIAEIEHQSGVPRSRLFQAVANMHRLRLIHVRAWDISPTGPMSRVWAWGGGKDAPRPKPMPRVRRHAAHVLGRSPWIETVVGLKRQAGIKRPSARQPSSCPPSGA